MSRLGHSRSCRTKSIQQVWGAPLGHLQPSSHGSWSNTCLARQADGILTWWSNHCSWHLANSALSGGCLIWEHNSMLEMWSYHLIPSMVCRHLLSKLLIILAQYRPYFCTVEENGKYCGVVDTELDLSADGCMMPNGLPQGVHGGSSQLPLLAYLWVHITSIRHEQAEVAELIYKLHTVFVYS